MRGGHTDRLGWTRIRKETTHKIPLFQSEGMEQGIEIEMKVSAAGPICQGTGRSVTCTSR